MRAKLTRRKLLRGMLGGAAVSLPLPLLDCWLNGNGTALADGVSLPRRFGLFFWGNGNLPARWTPIGVGEGAAWALSDQLAPLAAVKHRIAVVSGMSVRVPSTVPHLSGACGLLAGAAVIGDDVDYTFPSASIDQLIADAVGGDTVFRSLEFGTAPDQGLSYNGPYSVNPPEPSPFALFERVFGGGFVAPGGTAVPDPSLGLRRSVLDAVMGDISSLRSSLPASDQARLDAHLEGVRALEERLAKIELDPPTLAACAVPAEPEADYPDVDGRPQLELINQVFADLAAMILACDQTRVISNQFTYPVNNELFPGATDGHHNLTHDEPGDQPQVHAITVQCMEAFAAFVATLDAVPEGDGTLLDNCAVLATSDVSEGRTHALDDYPLVIAGNACGFLKNDLHHRSYAADNASKVMLALMHAMDVPVTSFGVDDAMADEPLAELLA